MFPSPIARCVVRLGILFAGFLCVAAHAQTPAAPARPKIGLALSGGGARGAAHIGVLKVLEEMKIPIDYIAGTSMGALVGASYASGTSIEELEKRLESADWDDLFTDTSPRPDRSFQRKEEDLSGLMKLELGFKEGSIRLPAGAISGQKLDSLFSIVTRNAPGVTDFDRMPIPFRAVATDAETGKMVVFKKGRLPDVMRASMSVPGAIAPFPIGTNIYLDGGLTRNLPIDVVREMGADIVIAVNIASPLLKRKQIQSIVDVSLQMINILTEQNMQASLASLTDKDTLITPPLDVIGSTDFALVAQAIAIGASAMREKAPLLQSLAVSAGEFSAHRATQIARMERAFTSNDKIDEVRVTGLVRANEDELKRTLNVEPGDAVDFRKLNIGVSQAFGTGYFERVNYSLNKENGRNILIINAREKQWGPNYLRFGLTLGADSIGEGRFNMLMRYQQTQFNDAGAEWRHDVVLGRDRRFFSQFQQPFAGTGIANSFSVLPSVEFARRPLDIFQDGRRLAQYQVSSTAATLALGADIGRNAIVRIGVSRGSANTLINTGSLESPDEKFREGGVRLRAQFDNLDDPSFPRAGRAATLDYYTSLAAFGATSNYRKLEATYQDQISFGRHTFSGGLRYGRGYGSALPVFDQFSLGGFLQLSGYRPGELLGGQVAFGRLTYYQRMSNLQNPFGKNVYLGLSAEAGRIRNNFRNLSDSETKNSVGLFAGFDTVLGPIYLGYGRTQERATNFYLFLGQP